MTVEALKTDATASELALPEDTVTVTQDDESTTVTIPPAKTPEQLQQEADDNGWLKVWTGPGDSWWTWFKEYFRIRIPWLNLTIQGWVGFPAGLGLDECKGLENIFISIYKDVGDEVMSVWQSAIINAITTAIVAFSAGAIATFLTQGTPAYWIALGAYSVGAFLAILAINSMADRAISQSILYGVGGALIGFVIGLLFTDFIFNWGRSVIMSNMMGTPIQIAAVKATVNYFINFGIKATFAVGFLMTFLNKFFLASNAVLGATALGLGYLKGL